MRASSVRATAHVRSETSETGFKRGVRERSAAQPPHRDYQDRANRLAHPSVGLVAQLNATWRVVDDPLQWRLQRKKGNPRTKNAGWRDQSFCTTREGLLRCVHECSGNVVPAALAKLTALPHHHAMQNLDVRGTDRAHAHGQSKPLVPRALKDSGAGEQAPRSSEPALS
jgi:hypothetical protein